MPSTLLTDEFDQLPVGTLSANVGAHTEYHFLPEAAPKGNWSVACFASGGDRGLAWHVESQDGKNIVTQTIENKHTHTHPMLNAGDFLWENYTLTVSFTPKEKTGQNGVVFRYHNNRCYYFFGFYNDAVTLLMRRHDVTYRQPNEKILATQTCAWTPGQTYTATVTVTGTHIQASIENVAKLEAHDSTWPKGKIGLLSDSPTQYHSVHVTTEEQAAFHIHRDKREKELDDLRAQNPKPVLWKKFSTKGFGVGRNLRFGDLTGNGVPDVLIGQVYHHGPRDAYCELSCLTAMNFDGDILWRVGKPNPDNNHLTNDVGFQIVDVDGDGKNEVVYCMNFEIIILDGATGQVKHRAPTPKSYPPADKFPQILGDSLFFCDMRGQGHKGDILIKDRYWRFWMLNEKLEIQWEDEIRTGHYPFALDIDNDGKDELALGHALYDHDGTQLWNIENTLQDHIDGVAIGNFNAPDEGPLTILYAGSDSGIFFADLEGNILKHHWIGHGQNPALLKLRDDLPGLQVVSINFWGNQGILHFYDKDGNIYHDAEPNPFGSMCLPINWTGNGTEYFVHNPNPRWGGLFDGWGRPVVQFPDDGHPDMCNAVLNITGDCRDEIVVWDPNELWVYTQDDGPKTGKLYNPIRNSLSNYSNYQATVSLPNWTE